MWEYTFFFSQAAFAEEAMGKQFHVSQEVTILGISLFLLGLGLGPLVVGPISEIYGHRAVYSVSFSYFFVAMFPIAFAPNISTSLVYWNHRARSDASMHTDSCVFGLSIPCRVLRGCVSQCSWGQRQRHVPKF